MYRAFKHAYLLCLHDSYHAFSSWNFASTINMAAALQMQNYVCFRCVAANALQRGMGHVLCSALTLLSSAADAAHPSVVHPHQLSMCVRGDCPGALAEAHCLSL